jgi:pimeloyl-ACP methyl ester carboxylesterase
MFPISTRTRLCLELPSENNLNQEEADCLGVAYATALGYPALFIDRLGNGLSSHPDPLAVDQVPANIETIHAIIALARAGSLAITSQNRAFTKIILVGHSIGSLIVNPLTAKYPADADATVLTGYSKDVDLAVIPEFVLLPADIVDPARFGNLAPGYTEATNEPGTLSLFWWPTGYDVAFADYDYSIRGTLPLGEGVSVSVAVTVATAYTNPAYVISGEHDEIFCAQLLGAPSCDPNGSTPSILAQTQSLYPNARAYGWYSVPNCGHDWQFHYNNQLGFAAVHTWLQGVGF